MSARWEDAVDQFSECVTNWESAFSFDQQFPLGKSIFQA